MSVVVDLSVMISFMSGVSRARARAACRVASIVCWNDPGGIRSLYRSWSSPVFSHRIVGSQQIAMVGSCSYAMARFSRSVVLPDPGHPSM